MTRGKSIAEKLWDRLDEVTAFLMQDKESGDYAMLIYKGEARGLAQALVLMCQPYYADERAVSKQALKRWKMKAGEIEHEPTPGYAYNPPPTGTVYRQPVAKARPVVAKQSNPALSAAALKQARVAVNGGLPKEAVAKVYKVTVAQLEAALATPE